MNKIDHKRPIIKKVQKKKENKMLNTKEQIWKICVRERKRGRKEERERKIKQGTLSQCILIRAATECDP